MVPWTQCLSSVCSVCGSERSEEGGWQCTESSHNFAQAVEEARIAAREEKWSIRGVTGAPAYLLPPSLYITINSSYSVLEILDLH